MWLFWKSMQDKDKYDLLWIGSELNFLEGYVLSLHTISPVSSMAFFLSQIIIHFHASEYQQSGLKPLVTWTVLE